MCYTLAIARHDVLGRVKDLLGLLMLWAEQNLSHYNTCPCFQFWVGSTGVARASPKVGEVPGVCGPPALRLRYVSQGWEGWNVRTVPSAALTSTTSRDSGRACVQALPLFAGCSEWGVCVCVCVDEPAELKCSEPILITNHTPAAIAWFLISWFVFVVPPINKCNLQVLFS